MSYSLSSQIGEDRSTRKSLTQIKVWYKLKLFSLTNALCECCHFRINALTWSNSIHMRLIKNNFPSR